MLSRTWVSCSFGDDRDLRFQLDTEQLLVVVFVFKELNQKLWFGFYVAGFNDPRLLLICCFSVGCCYCVDT